MSKNPQLVVLLGESDRLIFESLPSGYFSVKFRTYEITLRPQDARDLQWFLSEVRKDRGRFVAKLSEHLRENPDPQASSVLEINE